MLALLDPTITPNSSTVGASIGAGLLLAVNVALLVLDAAAFVTLGGLVSRNWLGTWTPVGVALLFCAGWFVPTFVLVIHVVRARQARQTDLAVRPARIAQLEREVFDRPQGDRDDG